MPLLAIVSAVILLSTNCSYGQTQNAAATADVGKTDTTQSASFRLMTLNIPFFPGGKKMGRFVERQDSLQRIVSQWEQPPDVIALQEVWLNGVKQSLGDRFRDQYPHQSKDTSKHKGAAINSGLMIISKFPIKKQGIKHYSDAFGTEKLARKGVMGVELEVSPRKTVFVFTTHLQSSSKPQANEVKLKQMKEAKVFIDEFTAGRNGTIFLTGDFNLSIEKNPEYLVKVTKVYPYVRDTYDPPAGKKVKASTWGGMHGTGFQQRIDHIWILREQRRIEGYSYITLDIDEKTSNHLALLGEFRL